MSEPRTLLEVLELADSHRTAIILPDAGLSVTYDELRQQVRSMAGVLHEAGIRRGDRVAMALSNGLDAVVAFLAAATAGTAAPLNPGYKFEEFCFYLADTNAKVLIVPREDGAEAR
ncbi:MAG: AMP-binding protein, partial [Bryobacteraceae bacterium]